MAPSFRVRLGNRIRQLRQDKGWRQSDLAAHADLSQTHICDVELARRELGLEALKRIAGAFGIKASELLRLAGE
jgi:transcriptional regulator with XRE-family HTH domain